MSDPARSPNPATDPIATGPIASDPIATGPSTSGGSPAAPRLRTPTRRDVLKWSLAAAGTQMLSPRSAMATPAARDQARPRIAAVFTELRFRSHAYNILENCFEPFLFRGQLVDPGIDVVSFYADQFPANDMARSVSRRLGIPLFDGIDKALCLGGDTLDVDGVMLIGEHGDYPVNELGQKMYPRKEFFDQIVATMRRSGRFVPVFNDKHLSYRWDWARQMVDVSRQHQFPLLAGSSVPLAQRIPELGLPPAPVIEEAVAVHGGGMEVYDFHALEVLQSIVEGRRGGETGIERVELLSREQMLAAEREGRWSMDLLLAALRREQQMGVERQKRPDRPSEGDQLGSLENPETIRNGIGHGLLLTYRDGLRGTIVQFGKTPNRWNFACRLAGGGDDAVRSTAYYNGPWGNRCLFKALSHAIHSLFIERESPYPVERTLLVSGVLEQAMKSHQQGGKPRETPELVFSYAPRNFEEFRENGASWQRLTAVTPQPTTFTPGDRKLLTP